MNVNKININQSEATYYIASDIYDVSYHNNNATFGSLSELLSSENLSTLIPTEIRCGGMTIRFIQSSDNKYVQYRLMSNEFTTDTTQWAIDDESVYIENPEFLSVKTDAEGKLLWWIETDGSVNWSKGVPQPIQVKLQELEEKIKDNSYDDKPLSDRISDNEAAVVAINEALDNYKVEVTEALNKKMDEEYIESDEFIHVHRDSDGKLLWWIEKDGTVGWSKGVPTPIQEELKKLEQFVKDNTEGDESVVSRVAALEEAITKKLDGEYIENPEFIHVVTDSEERIISYRDTDGVLHEEKGINTKEIKTDNVDAENISCNHISVSDDAATELTEALRKIGFTVETPVDLSDESFINLPSLPTCALLNISGVDSMPTSKTTNAKMIVEVWDMNGNYFRKKCIGNAQGDSSMAHPKKNFALDFCEDDWIGDDTTTIKIGPWVSQDSFHFKAFATSITKGECPIGYKIFEKFLETKPFHKRAPYMEYYEGNYTTSNSPSDDLSQNMQFQARCYPDGFPCIVYLNGSFYGIFSWQLKKHRDNMAMGRNETDHIHLDGWLANENMWNGTVGWAKIEVRNPKPKSSKWTLLCQDGSKYDGDNPKELMGENSEFYNAEDKSCKNSAVTKTLLINATNYMSEIQVFKDAYKADATEENLNTLKAEIEKRFSVEWMIEYVLLMNLLQDGDSIIKNIQWATWGSIDGIVKWYPLPYDLDAAFGVVSTTAFSLGAPGKSTIGKDANSPVRYVWDYYYNELVSRYKELREKNVISYNEIMNLFLNWSKAIGFDNYEKEYEKWPESPCNRNSNISKDWKYIGGSYIVYGTYTTSWNSKTTYSKDVYTTYSGRCYKSLQGGNVNNIPLNNDEWWSDVTVKEGTYKSGDIIMDGKNSFYRFQAINDVTVGSDLSNRPFTAFYTQYPAEGGVYDSIYRISKWIERKIEIMDSQFV